MKKLNRLYLGTNTKMYKTIADTASFLTQLRQLTEDLADSPLTLFVIPSFTTLESANRIISGSHIRLGSPEHVLGGPGTVHRRNLACHA